MVVSLTSVHVNIGVAVTCIPFLKPIITGVQSGILASDVRSMASSPFSSGYLFSASRKRRTKQDTLELTGPGSRSHIRRGQQRGDSEESMVIKQTRDFTICGTANYQREEEEVEVREE